MEYFTRAWASGTLSESVSAKIEAAYAAYIDSLDRNSAIWRFATTVGLHDAYVDRVAANAGEIRLRLVTGDLQRGYWHTEIIYSNAAVTYGHDVLVAAVNQRPTEIWYDEFSSVRARNSHRFLLAPRTSKRSKKRSRDEFHIKFDRIDFAQMPAKDRMLPPLNIMS